MATLRNRANNPDMSGVGLTTVMTNFLSNPRGMTATTYWAASPGNGAAAVSRVSSGGPDTRFADGGPFIRYTQNTINTGGSCGPYYRDALAGQTTGVAGDTRYWQVWVRPSVTRQIRLTGGFKLDSVADVTTGAGPYVTCPAGEWTKLPPLEITATGDYQKIQLWPVATGPFDVGETLDAVGWVTAVPWDFFDGDVPNNAEFTYAFTGAASLSQSTATAGTVTAVSASPGTGGALKLWRSPDAPMTSSASAKSIQTTFSDQGSAGVYTQANSPGVAGDVVSVSCWVKFNVDRYVRLLVRFRNGSTTVSTDLPNLTFIPANTWTEVKLEGTTANQDYTNIQVWPWLQAPGKTLAIGDTMQLARVLVVDGPKLPPDGWWDGDEKGNGKYVFAWDGEPNASTSTRMDRIDIIHWWTRMWFGRLPVAYQEIDAVIQPEQGSFPLLRFMDGAGQVSGRIRDLSDLIISGKFMDPQTTPDYALRWLAQLLGVTAAQRTLDLPTLRTYLLDLVASGRPAVGTGQSIVDAARRFLTGTKQVTIQPTVLRRNWATNARPYSNSGWGTSGNYVKTYETVLGREAAVVTRAAAGSSQYIWYGRNVGTMGTGASTPTTTTHLIPITPGDKANVRLSMGTDSTNATGQLNIRFFNSSGTELAGTVSVSPATDIVPNTWQDFAHSATAPAGAAYWYVENVVTLKSGTTVGGERAWAGRAFLGVNDPGDYFAGDSTPGTGMTIVWDGTANASSATMTTTPHTIVVLARADEVPSGNLTTLANNIRSTGVVPAGHQLLTAFASATWDQYEAAVGATWAEADANQPTWRAADSLGINLS
ncbi:tail protein [Arthrobacter phage DrYang]|uniref:Minor tail protein n=1 Tax=Arthrobacter phage DrYang TaxID=2686080 RepID=A0A6B9J799_9CAUD|nr:tail protein [Arthrobacter phage DrYang]QGZ17140.1 hypothetical protein SEA_DRYANG_41 [Arthrobacter phage DrYang]